MQGSAVTAALCPALKLMNPLIARPLHPHYLQTLTELLFRATYIVTQRRQGIRHVREQQLVAGVSSTGSLQDFLEHYDLI